jgi:hypothetical protein
MVTLMSRNAVNAVAISAPRPMPEGGHAARRNAGLPPGRSEVLLNAHTHLRKVALISAVAVVPVALSNSAGSHTTTGASLRASLDCVTAPASCGFPSAASTGVRPGTALKAVPGQISSGPGWAYNAADQYVEVSGRGANLTGLSIPYNLDITASDVTIDDDLIVTNGDFGITLGHTQGVTIENSTIGGQNAAAGRVGTAIKDVYGDSTGMVIEGNNISDFKTGIAVTTGLIEGNYLHNPGYLQGDHTNGIFDDGSDQPLTIKDNTILNSLGQTDAISLDASDAGEMVANKTIEDNLLAGGDYAIYGGASLGNSTSNIVVEGNRFSQLYFAQSGQYGPAAYFDPSDSGNVWAYNFWSGSPSLGQPLFSDATRSSALLAVPPP